MRPPLRFIYPLRILKLMNHRVFRVLEVTLNPKPKTLNPKP